MAKTFKAQVEDFAKIGAANMLLVVKQSAQDVIEEISTPKAKGGNMPVRTGFLRASGKASLTGMPSGPERGDAAADKRFNETGAASYEFDNTATIAQIGEMELGDTLYYGWTAKYAKYREPHDGFLESGMQNWSSIVKRNVEKVRKMQR